MARLYANENFPFPAVLALRALGHEVLTTSDTGLSGVAVPDPEVLSFASARGLAVLTLNRRDFIRLHREHPDHAGIVACTFDPDFDALAARVHAELLATPDLSRNLLRVNRLPRA